MSADTWKPLKYVKCKLCGRLTGHRLALRTEICAHCIEKLRCSDER